SRTRVPRKRTTRPPDSLEPELRRRAEELLARSPGEDAPEADHQLRALVHELEVHQIELQLQNDELLAIRGRLETALQGYTELFDFAPIGYACLTPLGIIRTLNRAGARILGSPRGELSGRSLESMLAPASRPAFRSLLEQTLLDQGSTSDLEVSMAGEVAL